MRNLEGSYVSNKGGNKGNLMSEGLVVKHST